MKNVPSELLAVPAQPDSSSSVQSQVMASASPAAPEAKAQGAALISGTAHTPSTSVPQSTYPYISTSPVGGYNFVDSKDGFQPKPKPLATPTTGVGSLSQLSPPKLPSPPTAPTSSYSSFFNSSERARLLRSSRKLGRLLGATPVILGPSDELSEKDGTSTVYSLSTTDLHAATPDATSKTTSANADGSGESGTNGGTGEAGKLRGFILAMKALDGDILHGGKHSKARSKARGKENRERVKALAREAEEATRREREKEEKRAKRMSAPPTPTSFRLPSPSSIRPSFLSRDSLISAVSIANATSSGDALRKSAEVEESASLRATKRSGDYVQNSRRSRSKSRTRPEEARSGASSPVLVARTSADSATSTASRALGHRRAQTETNAGLPPLPFTSAIISTTPVSFLSSMSAPTSPNSSASVSIPANAVRGTSTPSTSAYASASEESDECPRTPGSGPDGAISGARAGVDVMDVLEEYEAYSAPSSARILPQSANNAEEEDNAMGDDERNLRRGEVSSDTDDDEIDDFEARELGLGDSGCPTFVDPWDPTRSPIEPIFGGVSDRAYSYSANRDERVARRRRLAKLTRYLGEQVPTELILQSGTGVGPRHAHVRSEPVIGMGVENAKGVRGQFGRGVAMGLPESIEEVAASKEWEAPSRAVSAKPTRRISIVAAKKLLPLLPATPAASVPSPSVSFPAHPAFSPLPSTSAMKDAAGAGAVSEKKPKRQRSLGRLVSLRAYSETSPTSIPSPLPEAPEPFTPILSPVFSNRHEEDCTDYHSHIATTTSLASATSTQERVERSRSPVPKDVAVSRKRSLAMGMLSGRDRQLVEDEWTPEAYEDVVSRLRKLK